MTRTASSSGPRGMWRSILLWMHWRRRSRERQEAWLQAQMVEQRERLLFNLPLVIGPVVEAIVHRQLLEVMQPLAQALERQDDLLMKELRQTEAHLESLMEDVLQSLQPPVREQLLAPIQVNGRWIQPASRHSSAS